MLDETTSRAVVETSRRQPEVVVVTGASAGVGRAAVRRFARERTHVGLIARGLDGLEGSRREVETAGGRALVLPADVSDADAVERATARVEEVFGPIDVWVNNATPTVFSPIKDLTSDEFRRMTEVTYIGYVNGTLSALRRMLARDRGVIVQVGSALAYRSIPLQSAYCASKHAISGFTESLRTELRYDKSNVHVTEVHLPALNTPQFSWNKSRLPRHPQPVPPIYQPEVAAEAVYFAAHARRREVVVGMSTVVAIYGDRIAPGLCDRYRPRRVTTRSRRTSPYRPPARTTSGSRFRATGARTGASMIALARSVCSSGPPCIGAGSCSPVPRPDWPSPGRTARTGSVAMDEGNGARRQGATAASAAAPSSAMRVSRQRGRALSLRAAERREPDHDCPQECYRASRAPARGPRTQGAPAHAVMRVARGALPWWATSRSRTRSRSGTRRAAKTDRAGGE